MGDLLGSLIWGAKSGQYCVIGGGSLHNQLLEWQLRSFISEAHTDTLLYIRGVYASGY
jgi:hypothetical protein